MLVFCSLLLPSYYSNNFAGSYKNRLADDKIARRHADHNIIRLWHADGVSMPIDELSDIPIPTTKVNDNATAPLHRSEWNR